MATKLMLANAESWVRAALKRRITLHRLGQDEMVINAPSMRTRARMALDPGSYRPMRVSEEPAVPPLDPLSATTRRRRG